MRYLGHVEYISQAELMNHTLYAQFLVQSDHPVFSNLATTM